MKKKLRGSGFQNIEVNFVSDEEISKINEKYLGRKGPATVITFPYPDAKAGEVKGEVFFCVEEIIRLAEKEKASIEAFIDKIADHVMESLRK